MNNPGINKMFPWMIWLLGALFYFYENVLQVSPGIMTQSLMKHFSINETELSILASFYFYAYAFVQIPAGIMIDNYNIKKVLLSAVFFCVFGCFLFSLSSTLWQASFGRFCIGLGSGFAAITAMKLATHWFAPKKFPFLVGLTVTLGMTGSIVGEGPLALMVNNIGWQQATNFLGAIGIILFIFIAFIVKENPRAALQAKEQTNIFNGLKEIIHCTDSWMLALYAGLMFVSTIILGGLWGVPFLMEFYSISKPLAASIVSTLFLGWVIGSPLTGILASYLDRKKVMLYGTIGALINILLILYYHFSSLNCLVLSLFAFGICSSCFLPAFSLIKDLHKPAYSGVVLGFMNTANTLAGALGLTFVGFLFKINWSSVFNTNINALENYQIILSILPISVVLSLIMILKFNSRSELSAPREESVLQEV